MTSIPFPGPPFELETALTCQTFDVDAFKNATIYTK